MPRATYDLRMAPQEDTNSKLDNGPGFRVVAAGIGIVIVALLVIANTEQVDVNFLVYKAHKIPLWWFTILVAVFSVVTERLVIAVIRRRRKN